MKKKILLSIFISSILVAQSIELKPLSITSTAITTDELKSTDAVEIYTAEDIQKAHVQNIYEFLNQQSSATATPSFGNSFMQKLDFRGYGIGDGYQNILITINGKKINNIDMTPQLLSAISPASIQRLEIIKSSGIVKGGDGANAGAINIITKKDSAKEITVYSGTQGTADGSFYLGHSEERFSISSSGEAQRGDGSRYINSAQDKDESSLKTASLNISYNPIDTLELRAGASFARTDITYGSFLTLDEYNDDTKQAGGTNWGAANQKYDTDALNLGFSYNLSDKISLNIDGAKEKKKSVYNSISQTDYEYDSLNSSLNYIDTLFSFTLGYDIFDGNLVNTKSDLRKISNALYFINEIYLGSSTIKMGARYEDISFKSKSGEDQDDTLYGVELGYNYTFDREKSLFANYSHAYQSSSLDRLFDWSSGAFTGYVKPSESDNFTVGFNYLTPMNRLKISLYYISLEDEIYYYADPTYQSSRNTNIDKSYKYGLDIYDKWLIDEALSVVLNYNYVQAVIDKESENGDDYSGNKLPGVSNHNIKATLAYSLNKNTSLALTQTYRSKTYAINDFNNNFAQKQDAYKSSDISISYTKERLELFAKISNLFNQKNGLWVEDNAIYPMNFTTTAIAGFKLKI
ncbi:TonB-dependent receptor [Sulfurimonas denitrificans DSM 1251]|uniref:TonB-dependent receptor n=1 Tax=Sulfurimonas denitrificans (strain ATCC 33889 / DSM 1251) TaxID=326298 RepID=Q30UD2_SULDN|nr:TonB-dependent receptor [Sulfurimonas denitrificans]ABB43399.1 TonB-dependent receptor [Sulfurimonas denitrificans DSM 1251]MDD3442251.1 TonB-dependent receptor [Sulfurimonas denitrificans]